MSQQRDRLHTVENDLAPLIANYERQAKLFKDALKGTRGEDPFAKAQLARLQNAALEQLQAIRKQVQDDADTIIANSKRKSVAVSDDTRKKVETMLSKGADYRQIAQWAEETNHLDAFPVLREHLEVDAYSKPATDRQDTPEKRIKAVEEWLDPVERKLEKQTFTSQELANWREAEDVRMSLGYLNREIDGIESYLSQQDTAAAWLGRIQPPREIHRWPGLPEDNRLANGITIPVEI